MKLRNSLRLTNSISLAVGLLLATETGCAHSIFQLESVWEVPSTPEEQPSPLWTTDPRTKGWNGVHVNYLLYEWGNVEADVHSSDERHRFMAQGKYRVSNMKSDAYPYGLLIVEFDGREERYRFAPGPNRAIIKVDGCPEWGKPTSP